ncbi:MAG TPA: FHA domain-containing protein, partial [Trebonia sp.]|nr:FHA domain-containing protein [Trebonia sp.]
SQDVVSGQGDDWRPPTFIMPATGAASLGAKPKIHEPEGSDFEYVSFLEPDGGQGAPGGEGDHNGHEVVVEADSPADNQAYGPVGSDLYVADPATVDGVMCARNHFNDPSVQYCRQCGIAMVQQTARYQRGPRPPLGVLLLDDGTGFTLDKDYVVGREPVLDGDVAAGRARPMRIPDPGGTVSRLHLRISLIGWQVEVRDLNSANGSVLHLPNGSEQRLMPGDTQVIEPGTKIVIGHRNLQYQSYRAG